MAAPPDLPGLQLRGPADGCPPEFVGCLDLRGGIAAEEARQDAYRWMADAWARCGGAEQQP